jgi:hypothetical protein
LTCLPFEALSLEVTAVSLGLVLDEAWNAEPAVLDKLFAQGTGAPLVVVFTINHGVEDEVQFWAFLVT